MGKVSKNESPYGDFYLFYKAFRHHHGLVVVPDTKVSKVGKISTYFLYETKKSGYNYGIRHREYRHREYRKGGIKKCQVQESLISCNMSIIQIQGNHC